VKLLIGLVLSANLTSLTPTQIATIHRLEDRLMAPCCYTQTIREHQSEVAEQMREEVTQMVSDGKSEKEIIAYYKTKYGETILVTPDGAAGKIIVAVPAAVLVLGLFLVGMVLRPAIYPRAVATAATLSPAVAAVDAQRVERIRRELEERP
jgi:cytochrome c-type biogenesis protein CcmH